MSKLEVGTNDLQTYCKKHNLGYLLDEWHPTKNGDLKPMDVSAGSNRKVWWHLPYDDPKTGKHFDFEWEAVINDRANGRGCPYLFGKAVWAGFNDLATTNPKLAKQWHPAKNGDLKPTDVTANYSKKVWWQLPYDDPGTGRHFDFEWQTTVNGRNSNGNGCPYLTNKRVYVGFNDLKTTNPEIAAQWHPAKNGKLKPTDVTSGSPKKVWWYLPYDDPKTGQHFDFEWKAAISDRADGSGCPYLSGSAVWTGFNDLATANPELAAEWDYSKNIDLQPSDVTICSHKKVYWLCPLKHSYYAIIYNRYHGSNCPVCAKEINTSFPEQAVFYYIKKYFHDAESGNRTVLNGRELDIYIPSEKIAIEYDGKKWHQDSEKDEAKKKLCEEHGIMLYRIREINCPVLHETEYLKLIPCTANDINSLEHAIEYLLTLLHRLNFDVNIDRDRTMIYSQYIHTVKENSLAMKYPELAAQWHPTKNGDLTPWMVSCASNKVVHWLFPYDDPETGKHFSFEWKAVISSRTNGNGCPYLSNQKVWVGFNDLKTTHPELAIQWHPVKNGNLKPTDVTSGSPKKVRWYLPYDDSKTGEHFDFEWEATINSRTNGSGCPYLSNQKVWVGFNDLKTVHPELAAQWHPSKNGNLKPTDVTSGSPKKVWWYLPYDDPKTGKHFDFEWEATINSRTNGSGCPYLFGQAVWAGFNDLASKFPKIAEKWHPVKNINLKPTDVTAGSHQKVWWIDENGEEQYLPIATLVKKCVPA